MIHVTAEPIGWMKFRWVWCRTMKTSLTRWRYTTRTSCTQKLQICESAKKKEKIYRLVNLPHILIYIISRQRPHDETANVTTYIRKKSSTVNHNDFFSCLQFSVMSSSSLVYTSISSLTRYTLEENNKERERNQQFMTFNCSEPIIHRQIVDIVIILLIKISDDDDGEKISLERKNKINKYMTSFHITESKATGNFYYLLNAKF